MRMQIRNDATIDHVRQAIVPQKNFQTCSTPQGQRNELS
jgi:hypothetical protein